jgi:hypothetical protein
MLDKINYHTISPKWNTRPNHPLLTKASTCTGSGLKEKCFGSNLLQAQDSVLLPFVTTV